MAGFLGGFRSMASVGVRIIVLPKPPLDHRPIPVPSRRGSTVQPIALCGVPHNSQQFIRAVPDDADEFFSPSMQSAWNLRTPFAWMCRLLRKINGGCQREVDAGASVESYHLQRGSWGEFLQGLRYENAPFFLSAELCRNHASGDYERVSKLGRRRHTGHDHRLQFRFNPGVQYRDP